MTGKSASSASCISEEDVAKRLMDYGFHAPTISFPVAGTLMIEPTESESKLELDRFIEAMISIRKEIARVESGELDALDNPLKHAPHTLADIMDGNWQRGYSKQEAAWPVPVPGLKDSKFWRSVNRIDHVYGDCNLYCACPAMDTYQYRPCMASCIQVSFSRLPKWSLVYSPRVRV